MARSQTIFSEIYTAMSIFGTDLPNDILCVKDSDNEIYQQELLKRTKSKANIIKNKALSDAGEILRRHILGQGINNFQVKWVGNDSLSGIESVAKDLEIKPLNWRISIKENADVFINGSTTTIFIDLPNGNFGQKVRGEDWFVKVAPEELQEYYLSCNGNEMTGFTTIKEYYNHIKINNKKEFSKYVSKLHCDKISKVLLAYQELCNKVSIESANIFNLNFKKFELSRNNKNRLTPIFHFFFKINGVAYYLIGSEKNKSFAVELPSSSEWVKKYEFTSIEAIPKKAGQPEVVLNFSFKNKETNAVNIIPLKIEIRWSHGKFCGNPEAKVYKQWSYTELPWVKVLK